MERIPGPNFPAKKSAGMTAAKTPEIRIPTSSERPMSRGRVSKPKRMPSAQVRRGGAGAGLPTGCGVDSSAVGGETHSSRAPPKIPEKNVTSTVNTANTGPSRACVANTLSTPVCGVESRNASVAPRLAPCLRSDAATGSTPHEHSGKGTPISDAFTTCRRPGAPKCRRTKSADMTTESAPASAKPTSRYGDISCSTTQVARRHSHTPGIPISPRRRVYHRNRADVPRGTHSRTASPLPARFHERPAAAWCPCDPVGAVQNQRSASPG